MEKESIMQQERTAYLHRLEFRVKSPRNLANATLSELRGNLDVNISQAICAMLED